MNPKSLKLAAICFVITCLAVIGFYAFSSFYHFYAARTILLIRALIPVWLVCLVILALRINPQSVKIALICLEITCLVVFGFYAFPSFSNLCEALPIWLVLDFLPIWLVCIVILVLDVIWIIVVFKRPITKNVYFGIFLVYLVLQLSAGMLGFLAFLQLF